MNTPKPTNTKLTPIRLTESDLAEIEAIKLHRNLPSIAAVVRYAVKAEYRKVRKEK